MGKMPSSRRASYDSCRKSIAFQVCIVIPFAPTQFKESNVFIPAQFNKSSLLYKEAFSSLQIKGLAKFPKPKLLFLKKKKKVYSVSSSSSSAASNKDGKTLSRLTNPKL